MSETFMRETGGDQVDWREVDSSWGEIGSVILPPG
jgi:hypothetical protein